MSHLDDARQILRDMGLPTAQQNERSALCLLALLNLTPERAWQEAEAPLMGITPMMMWMATHYQKQYAPNTRETVRRQTMHQLVAAGIALYNPDHPARPVNSPKAVYQIAPAALALLRTFGSKAWPEMLAAYREAQKHTYGTEREQHRVSLRLAEHTLRFSPGPHSELIRAVVEEFGPRFVPAATLLYAGDTENKWAYLDNRLLAEIGVQLNTHGKMPDVVLYDATAGWLVLVECVTSHGPINAKRHAELQHLFAVATAGLIFVTAFPTRALLGRYLAEIAWESEVWIADSPAHLIHFDGERFLGPYSEL